MQHAYAHQPFVVGGDGNNSLVFILSGSCQINSEECTNYVVGENNMLMCYNRGHYEIMPLTEMTVLVAHFSKLSGAMCDVGAVLQRLKSRKTYQYEFCAVEINEKMSEFVAMLTGFLDRGILCASMHESMLGVMFVVLKFYYQPDVIANMFYNLYDEKQAFCTMVEGNRGKAKNLQHLAELCGYDINTFNVIFRRYYKNITPGVWLKVMRKDEVFYDLTHTDAPIKFIADKFGFASASHMGEFCKKYLGGTPSSVRAAHKGGKKRGSRREK